MKHQTVRSGRKSTIYGFPVKLKVNSVEDGYRALALSIVKQALYDLDELNFYKTDYVQQNAGMHESLFRAEVENFLRSRWFRVLTGTDRQQQDVFLKRLGVERRPHVQN